MTCFSEFPFSYAIHYAVHCPVLEHSEYFYYYTNMHWAAPMASPYSFRVSEIPSTSPDVQGVTIGGHQLRSASRRLERRSFTQPDSVLLADFSDDISPSILSKLNGDIYNNVCY